MKKITNLILVLGLIVIVNNNVNAQAFQKGNKNIDVGIGFGAYGTTQTVTTTFNGFSATTSESDGAASTIIPIQFEYGIGDKIGIGGGLTFNNYIINDSDRVNVSSVKAIDFGASFNYHLLNADKNDLFITVGLGISSLNVKYTTNEFQFIESISGSGVYFSLGLTDRIFFSDKFGILFNLSYRGYNYSKLDAEFSPEIQALITSSGITYEQSWKWNFKGVHIGTGLAFKF